MLENGRYIVGGYAGSYNPARGGDIGCLQTAECYSFDEDRYASSPLP